MVLFLEVGGDAAFLVLGFSHINDSAGAVLIEITARRVRNIRYVGICHFQNNISRLR